MKAVLFRCCALVGLSLLLVGTVRADVFVLANGGRLVGELLNPEETLRQSYVIRTPDGAEVTLDRAQVKQVQHPRPDEQEYEQIEPRYADTVEGQWALAQWCAEHNLRPQREKHLRRILELNPDHADARRILGYVKFGDQWKTPEEEKSERGLVLEGGRWITPQEKRIREEKKEAEAAERAWAQKLRRMMAAAANDSAALEALGTINDPVAVPAIQEALEREKRDEVRILFLRSLGQIGNNGALQTLAARAIDDPIPDVRLAAIEQLKQRQASSADFFIARLNDKKYKTEVIHRAAVALKHLGGPSAILPLINALITAEKHMVNPNSGPGQLNPSFNSQGNTSFGFGARPVPVYQRYKNRPVLEALVTLTGVNFQFDQDAWKRWYAEQRREGNTNTRRDEEPAGN